MAIERWTPSRTTTLQEKALLAAAEAQKDTEIKVAQAQREAAVARAVADQERVIAETASVTRQAEAHRDLEIKKATYVESVQRQKAQADKAYEIQTAMMDQQVTTEKVKVQLIEREGQTRVQEAEIKRREKELQATTLKTAEIEAQRITLLAEADKRRVELEAEGRAQASIKEGQARIDVDLVAGEAQAKVTRLNGEAEAAVIKAKGEAEAEAMRKKASAFQSYNEAAVLDRIIGSLPDVVNALAQPLSKVDKITVVSTGGNGHGTGVDKITADVTRMVAQVPDLVESLSGVRLGDLVKALPRLRTGAAAGSDGNAPVTTTATPAASTPYLPAKK